MEIYLIRHTAPDIEKGICYGQTDIPLKETFAQEAETVLKNILQDVEVIYSSPLTRCLRLADYLSHNKKRPVQIDDRLKELDFGNWEMKRWNDIEPAQLHHWMDDYVNVPCPGGESYQDLADRTTFFLDQLRASSFKKVAIVTHHGVMKAMYAHVNKVSLNDAMNIQFPYGNVFHLICIF
jgi:alpha-ribazole phosphatase